MNSLAQDPQNHPCGSRDEPTVTATAALAETIREIMAETEGFDEPQRAELIAATVAWFFRNPPTDVVDRAAQAIVDERWSGTQPGFDRKPPGWKVQHVAEARAVLAALFKES